MEAWSRMARPRCSECGHQPLGWTTAVQLLLVLDDLEERKRLAELIRFVGGDSDAWRCEKCGAWGVFGPAEALLPSRRERRAARRRR
jgi:hypothetical protein